MNEKLRIFDFKDYKLYLERCSTAAIYGKAFKTRLASAISVNPAFISQVLNGKAHLSAEQADLASQFLSHSEVEREYFYLLVQHGRAGTRSLQSFLRKKMEGIRREQDRFRNRLDRQREVSDRAREKYYSSWIYSVVHLMTGIPEFQTPSSLVDALRVRGERIEAILRFLEKEGLLREENGRWIPTSTRIHLSADDSLFPQHHQTWKRKAMESTEFMSSQKLHFCGVVTLSRADAVRIRDRLKSEIEASMKVVADSPEETLYALNVDFFSPLPE